MVPKWRRWVTAHAARRATFNSGPAQASCARRFTPLVLCVVVDTLEIIRQLESDPALRAHLRAVLLGDEMLSLPEITRHLAEALDQLTERVDQLTVRLDQLTERLDQLTEAIDEFRETTERRLEEIEARLEGVEVRLDRVEVRLERVEVSLDGLRGWAYEDRAREHAPAVLGKVAGGLRRVRVVSRADLADQLDDAVDAGKLSEEEREEVLNADFVARAVRRSDRSPLIMVGEVSVAAGRDDIDRAARRAVLAGGAFGLDAIGVVVAAQTPEFLGSWRPEVVRVQLVDAA